MNNSGLPRQREFSTFAQYDTNDLREISLCSIQIVNVFQTTWSHSVEVFEWVHFVNLKFEEWGHWNFLSLRKIDFSL